MCPSSDPDTSGSTTAEIQLKWSLDGVMLTVSDTGRGIETGTARRDGPMGVGLAGMKARLKQLGGRLEIQSSAAGTTVSAILPRAPLGSSRSPQA
jgi:signal transduction histidine kinase